MIRKLMAVGIVVVVLAIVPEALAHFGFEYAINAAVAQRDPGAQHIASGVPIPVLPGLIRKSSISTVVVSARHVNLRTLTADRVTAVATNVHIDMPTSLVNERAQITHIDRVHLTLGFTEEEASAVLPAGFKFRFGKDTVTLQGLATSVTGTFRLEPPARMVFSSVGSSVPGLSRLPAISFPVPPLASCVQSVALTPGYLTVTCLETKPSTDFLPHQ